MKQERRFRYGIRAAALFTALVLVLSSCGYGERSYEKGREAFEKGDYETSVREFSRAISQGYANADVYADLAYAELKTGDTEKALKNMNTALKKEPEDPDLKKRIGLFYREAGDLETALLYLNEALPEDKNYSEKDTETLGFRGEVLFRMERYPEAIDTFLTLIEMKYHVLEHDILIGEAYLKMNQIYAAVQYFRLVRDDEAAGPELLLRICQDLEAYGQKREAKKCFEVGLERAGKDGTMDPARFCIAVGYPEKAEAYFEDENSREARLAHAMVLVDEGKYADAEVLYRALIAEGEGGADVYNQYLIMKVEEGDYDAAFQLLAQVYALADERERKNAMFNEIVIYERMQDYGTAFEKAWEFKKAYPLDTSADREYDFLKRAAK